MIRRNRSSVGACLWRVAGVAGKLGRDQLNLIAGTTLLFDVLAKVKHASAPVNGTLLGAIRILRAR